MHVQLVFRAACYALILTLSLRSVESRAAESSSEDGFRIDISDGPYQQWVPVTLSVDSDGPGSVEIPPAADVCVTFTSPTGVRLTAPTFQNSADGLEGQWQCRFTPREVGTYTATVDVKGKTDATPSLTFDVERSVDRRGFLQVNRKQPYYLRFDNGDQFRGIGVNIGWEPRRRRNEKYTYAALFPRIAGNGLNTVRTWMCPWNMPLEWESPSLGEYNQDALARLDEVLALAERYGVYLVLVLGYHGELQTESGSFPNNDRWKENPYNVANGGPCATPAEFFTNEQAKALYKQRLKLLVARVACHPHLLAWEFWNEVDHFERRGPVPGSAIVAWHREMADYLHDIDIYDHPITTSISSQAPSGLWALDGLDLIMLHPYGPTDKFASLLTQTHTRYDKPAIAGEFSYTWRPVQEGEAGLLERELRLGLWRGLMSPTPVLPMTWWWEFHDSRNDWRHYRPVAEFSRRMTELDEADWKPVRLKLSHKQIECHGIAVENQVFLWVRNGGESPLTEIAIEIEGAAKGDYKVTQFDTITGKPIGDEGVSLQHDAGSLKLLNLSLPGQGDTSFKLSQ